jgi:hypothetical protein
MSGQVSAVWNIFASVPTVGALLIGGTLSDVLEERNVEEAARILFLIGATIMALLAIYAAWRPASVYDNVRNEHGPATLPLDDVKRLMLYLDFETYLYDLGGRNPKIHGREIGVGSRSLLRPSRCHSTPHRPECPASAK